MKVSAKRYGKGFTLVELLVVIAIIVALAAIATPMAFQQLKKAAMTTAINNGKQIGQALIIFDQDYGSFPDQATAQQIPGAGGSASSNDLLRQLVLARTIDTESVFYAKIGGGIQKVDNQIQGNQAIGSRENAWAYVTNQDGTGLSSASNSQLPVLMTPLISGSGSSYRFSADPFANKAVVVRLNNAAETLNIFDGGEVDGSGSNNLFPQIFDASGNAISSAQTVTTMMPDGINLQN